MKSFIINKISFIFCSIFWATFSNGQLKIQQFDLPSQGFLNQQIQVSAEIKNVNESSLSGNLKFYLINQTYPELGIFEFAAFQQMQFFASGQSRNFSIILPLSSDFFRIGGNTVVIWPSMVGQPSDTVNIIKEIYIDEVSVTGNHKSKDNWINFFPNPGNETLYIIHSSQQHLNYSIITLEGKLLKAGTIAEQQINISDLNQGIYFIQVKNHNQQVVYMGKFIKQ